jgi:hypothetical protein
MFTYGRGKEVKACYRASTLASSVKIILTYTLVYKMLKKALFGISCNTEWKGKPVV